MPSDPSPSATRLLVILAALALVPAIGVTIAWSVGVGRALPLIGEAAAWERVAGSGSRAIEGLRGAELTAVTTGRAAES